MPNSIASKDLLRLQKALDGFVSESERWLAHPRRKCCRALRSFCGLQGRKTSSFSAEPVNASFLYDTKENRWVCDLIASVIKHFDDLKARYAVDEEAEELWKSFCGRLENLHGYPSWQAVFDRAETEKRVYDAAFFHAYVILKDALAELEAELEIGLSQGNWDERDVLVGSFGSEKQFRHNLAKKYYYAPERHFDPTCFPIRYIALYQSSHFSETGIRYYGAVTAIRRVKRKKIRFGVRRKNGEEDYYLFRVKEWKKLTTPIEIQDEGVFAPKYTNLLLLMSSRKTYELFHITSEQEWRVWRQIRRILSHASDGAELMATYPIEGGKSIRIKDGNLSLLDEKGALMRVASLSEFSLHPTQYIDDFFACVARGPKQSELPQWVLRENEEYEAKYGEPYRDEF